MPALDSAPNSFVYATDFNLDAAGHLLVADRGANAVEIFSPAGGLIQKIPVFGPVSIAALPENEFAVVTLRAQAPVEIMDEHGKLIRMFGGLSEALTSIVDANSSASSPLAEPGAIANDSAGHLYHAVARCPIPRFADMTVTASFLMTRRFRLRDRLMRAELRTIAYSLVLTFRR